MTRAAAALTVLAMVALVPAATGTAADDDVAPGFVTGREHEARIRPVLTEVPAAPKKLKAVDRSTGEAAVGTCDPTQVAALGRTVPTTERDGDAPTACVVLASDGAPKGDRLMLGPAPLTGSEIANVLLRRTRGERRLLHGTLTSRGHTLWTFFSLQQQPAELALTLDGEVVGTVELTASADGSSTSLTLRGSRKGYPLDEAVQLQELLDLAGLEEVIELGRTASLSERGREIYAANSPAIDERSTFAVDCPLPEADETFVLGCFDQVSNKITVLRVDRLDIMAAMPVTAAHEMLHAAYAELTPRRREKIDRLIDEFLFASPQPSIGESLALYSEAEKDDELHSLLGTEVAVLSPELEEHYGRYFDDRAALIALFESYQRVFDGLESRIEQLDAELAALDGQLRSIESQAIAAGNEADRLGAEIDALRAQGRIDESNALVGPQNAAVDRANSLGAQYNALVNQYNAKVAEFNAIADSLGELYRNVTAEPLPTG